MTRRDAVLLVLSGITTGASWLCYYRALQTGRASVVVPIDKCSMLFAVALSAIFLKRSRPAAAYWRWHWWWQALS